MRITARWLSLLGHGIGALVAVVLAARIVAGIDAVAAHTPLEGLSYVEPWWLAVAVLPPTVCCFTVGSRRMPALLVVLFVALLGTEDDWHWCRDGKPSLDAPSFTVLALNVRYYRAGRAAVIDGIKSLDPDVALLSENRMDAGGAEELRADFSPYVFVAGRSDETAIASRLPVLGVTEVELPSRAPSLHRPNRVAAQANHPHRSFMHAQVDFHGRTVNVIAIRFIGGRPASDALEDRLEWGRYLLGAQEAEIRFFLDYLSRLNGVVVFGGDLNAPPTTLLVHELDAVASDAYLANHWVGLPTFPRKFPMLRLDYLFATNGLVATSATRPDLRVSDHCPVLARFAIAS